MFLKSVRFACRKLGLALLLVVTTFTPSFTHAQVVENADLLSQSSLAYEAKQFRKGAELLDQLIATGDANETNYYNAACGYALAGDAEAAFDRLNSALLQGMTNVTGLQNDADFNTLHADPRWSTLLAKVTAADAADPAAKLLDLLLNTKTTTTAERYLAAQGALRDGVQLGTESNSLLSQLYATVSTFAGDYVSANANYRTRQSTLDPVAAGYLHAKPMLDSLLTLTKDRRAVFLNESHAQADTRAANFSLLEPLRKQGFNYLALEGLSVKKGAPDGCQTDVIRDEALQQRGYPIAGKSGYYIDEPVYAEFVREAIKLGYRLYAYEAESYEGDGQQTQAMREQGEADNLACLFANDPKAKVLLVAGFSHISENPQLATDKQGWMAYRFKTKTGIDPLTIDTTKLLHRRFDDLEFDSEASTPGTRAGHTVGAYSLANDSGELFGDVDGGFDIALYIPPAVARDATPNWLDLGGARLGITIPDERCHGKRPCLIDAHKVEEPGDAVASDRCVLHNPDETSCRLYLTPGTHRLRFIDESMTAVGEKMLIVK